MGEKEKFAEAGRGIKPRREGRVRKRPEPPRTRFQSGMLLLRLLGRDQRGNLRLQFANLRNLRLQLANLLGLLRGA